MKTLAIILSAGRGRRMQTDKPKQYLDLSGKPVIYYSLEAFEKSEADDVFLVIAPEDEGYIRKEILDKYRFHKLSKVIFGGSERYISVYNALTSADKEYDVVLIHDGARPLVSGELIQETIEGAKRYSAYIPGVPSKDTLRILGEDGNYGKLIDRNKVYSIQTPQAFAYSLCRRAYDKLFAAKTFEGITDDALVLERMIGQKAKIGKGDYRNIKITTSEDMFLAAALLKQKK